MASRQFSVSKEDVGARLDHWLKTKMGEFSRGQIKHLLDQGKVLVNSRRVLVAKWILEPSDTIEVRLPEGEVPEAKGEIQRPAETRPQTRRRFLDVLYEDRDIIVVDKPAGVLTEPKGDSPFEHLLGMIKGYLRRKFKDSKNSFVQLAHRLDKDTSGVVVAIKSKAGERLIEQFRNHRIQREYVAIVEGRIEEEKGVIDFALEKGEFHGGRKVQVARDGKGMRALTRFRVEERYTNATLLHVQLDTGRTHQIRVHLAEKGHPIIGDALYGSHVSFQRQALHASRLAFKHPVSGKIMRFQSKLPKDLQELIDQLRGN